MALRTSTPHLTAPLTAHAPEREVTDPLSSDVGLSAARGIFYAAIGGAAVWAALIGGVVAVIQRLR